ncbi:hypothetical protein BC827DRAFT_1166424 [Russula dissimulans]|nr:hypothetical protein BC827DRAFT_1166424 [Russula dissimulans]
MANKLNLLMCGTGEYTTGWTGSGASTSDKKIGVWLTTRSHFIARLTTPMATV